MIIYSARIGSRSDTCPVLDMSYATRSPGSRCAALRKLNLAIFVFFVRSLTRSPIASPSASKSRGVALHGMKRMASDCAALCFNPRCETLALLMENLETSVNLVGGQTGAEGRDLRTSRPRSPCCIFSFADHSYVAD